MTYTNVKKGLSQGKMAQFVTCKARFIFNNYKL